MFPGEKRWDPQRWPLGRSGSIRPSPGEAAATFASAAASGQGAGRRLRCAGRGLHALGEANGERVAGGR